MATQHNVRPSRDGDQFHYLWAARRCLNLLLPKSQLIAVSIEGASAGEAAGGASGDTGDEIIDVGEYYGSEVLSQASKVRYIQLKHSTQRPGDEWTFSGLERTISGFAEKYVAVQAMPDGNALLQNVEFQFTSNRPVSSSIVNGIAELGRGASIRDLKLLAKMQTATGLGEVDLRRFCGMFQFDVGQPDYWNQRNLLVQDLFGYLPGNDIDAPVQLKELITRKALSESAASNSINKLDVLRALKTDEGRLFPAPCLIERIAHFVPREQAPELYADIVNAGSQPIIIHAEGGVGKSALSTRVIEGLPPGSLAILYDCFGNGQYRSPIGYRHRHGDALVQIANELGGRGLCHPLIPSANVQPSEYLKAFLHRITQAATMLRAQHTDALLAVVLDAADNAQMAAQEIGDMRSFARDLMRMPVPDGVRFVFFCRTHRQDLLDPPATCIRRELKPFSTNETATFLRNKFQSATDHDVAEFHRLSSQNPRVQALALSWPGELSVVLRRLGPNPTTVDVALGNIVEAAIAKLRDEAAAIERPQIDSICEGLASLRPLVPVSVLSKISDVSESTVRSFVLDLGRPLFVADGLIHFLDEPSETWFRENFKPKASGLKKFVRTLRPLSKTSAYVASALPQLMLEAGLFKELVDLALSSDELPEGSPVERRDIELQRLQFALKASLRAKRYGDAAKLSLKAGGETAGNKRQSELLQSNTDLAAKFLDADRIQDLVSRRTFGTDWLGSNNCYEAGLMSHQAALAPDARSRLRMAFEWLRNWASLPQSEREDEKVSDSDIAEMGITQLNLNGPEMCARFLASWRPKEVCFRTTKIVARRLVDQGRFQELDQLADVAKNNIWLMLAIVVELRAVCRNPPAHTLQRLVKVLARRSFKPKSNAWDYEATTLSSLVALTIAAIQTSSCDAETLLKVLCRYLPSSPPASLASRYSSTRAPYLKAYALRAALAGTDLSLLELAEEKTREQLERGNQYASSQEARILSEDVAQLLPWYKVWANTCAFKIKAVDVVSKVREASELSSKVHSRGYDKDPTIPGEVALLWFSTLVEGTALAGDGLAEFERWRNSQKAHYPATLTKLAHIAARTQLATSISVQYAGEAYRQSIDIREDAESKSGGFVDLARAILPVSSADAEQYFNSAVEVASRIGDENMDRWGALLDLADRAGTRLTPDPRLAYRLSRCAELTYEYVARDKYFNWEGTVEALVNLSPSSSLAILSRWRDRDFGNAQRLLPIAIDALTSKQELSPAIGLALIGVDAYWNRVANIKRALDACVTKKDKQAAIEFAFRYVSMGYGSADTWRELKEICDLHKLVLPALDQLIAWSEHREAISKKKGQNHSYTGDLTAQTPRDWQSVFNGVVPTTSAGIQTAYERYRGTDSPWSDEAFFKEMFARVPAGLEAEAIKSILGAADFGLYEFRGVLTSIPDNWKSRIGFKAALAKVVIGICRRHCTEITKSRYYQIFPINEACQLSGISEQRLATEVLEALAELSDIFGAGRLFTLNSLLALVMAGDEAASALGFGLELLEPTLKEDDGDGPWSTTLSPPLNTNAAVAGYIWAGLGAPQSAIRWQMAHAVRGLFAFDQQNIIRCLVALAKSNKIGSFGDARLGFYDLHAFQWFLISVARAAAEWPARVIPYVAFLKNASAKRHVLFRHFASEALLTLAKAKKYKPASTVLGALRNVNKPKFAAVARDRDRAVTKPLPEDKLEEKFYFGIDIGPHWFAPLARRFGVSEAEITRRARNLILKEWKVNKVEQWDDDQRHKRRIFRDGETMHSHGSVPRTDDYRFYLSYHAMMVVAFDLLQTVAPIIDRWEGSETASEWLKSMTLTRSDGKWLADRRDPLPLDWPAWKDEDDDKAWRWSIDRGYFDRLLFPRKDEIVVYGNWNYADSKREETINITSVLASPRTSSALMRSLQTVRANEYYLPSELEKDTARAVDFTLEGWIVDADGSKELDERDPWAGDFPYPPLRPATNVVEHFKATADLDQRIWWRNKRDQVEVLFRSEAWGDVSAENDDMDKERGERLTATFDVVREYLARASMDLVVTVKINRRYRRSRYRGAEDEEETQYLPDSAKIFVIRYDGTIETL